MEIPDPRKLKKWSKDQTNSRGDQSIVGRDTLLNTVREKSPLLYESFLSILNNDAKPLGTRKGYISQLDLYRELVRCALNDFNFAVIEHQIKATDLTRLNKEGFFVNALSGEGREKTVDMFLERISELEKEKEILEHERKELIQSLPPDARPRTSENIELVQQGRIGLPYARKWLQLIDVENRIATQISLLKSISDYIYYIGKHFGVNSIYWGNYFSDQDFLRKGFNAGSLKWLSLKSGKTFMEELNLSVNSAVRSGNTSTSIIYESDNQSITSAEIIGLLKSLGFDAQLAQGEIVVSWDS
jgi:hypothetical protein